jgi:hypothetical protein
MRGTLPGLLVVMSDVPPRLTAGKPVERASRMLDQGRVVVHLSFTWLRTAMAVGTGVRVAVLRGAAALDCILQDRRTRKSPKQPTRVPLAAVMADGRDQG